ncbi:hypothetical protein OG866_44010 [Streptomyces sp. NBC_00663]|uniref:hypothetical protein n=1 Tax=Streptomyces sp. NBC_00663 TaxID=2975801 RepID=UPI002E37BC85|nr:hypothetical protein [Streptomyces sp. NBC_00663]
MKKVSSFLSAAMVAALGVVPLAASPASAVQRCVHHEEYGKDVSDSVAFDFCIRADEDEVRVSVENFTCNTDNPSNFLLQCVVSNGLVETRKNGSTTYDYLPHLEVVANQRYVRWETSHPGCEEGDFVNAFIDDLTVSYHHWASGWSDVSFGHTFAHGGVRC